MRVTGGKYRGREVLFPKGKLPVRPAMAVMREALFSILGNIDGTKWADIFCGSGLVGIEALSRGAGFVHFVDKDKAKNNTLRRNLSWVEEPYQVIFSDAFLFLKGAREAYDFIYLDPPFDLLTKSELLVFAREALKRLNPNGEIILHYPATENLGLLEGLKSTKKKKYGGSLLEFLSLE